MSCSDPTESAVRQLRALQGKTRGIMAETVAGIIASASQHFPATIASIETQGFLLLTNGSNQMVPPLLLHGPAPLESNPQRNHSSILSTGTSTVKCRDHPPKNKKLAFIPIAMIGVSSRKCLLS